MMANSQKTFGLNILIFQPCIQNTIYKANIMDINQEIISLSNTKFSQPTLLELYGRQYGELPKRYWERKG